MVNKKSRIRKASAMKRILLFISQYLIIPAVFLCCSCGTGNKYAVRTKDFTLILSPKGEITGAVLGKKNLHRNLTGMTVLNGCRIQDDVKTRSLPEKGIEFTKTLIREDDSHTFNIAERFLPENGSIRWEIDIIDQGRPWSTKISTQLNYPVEKGVTFWCPWADSRQGEMSSVPRDKLISGEAPDDWADPLVGRPLIDMLLYYGAPYYSYDAPNLYYIPFDRNLFCIPLATVMEDADDLGLSLVLSPEDHIFDMVMTTTAAGEIVFRRLYNRLGQGRIVHFAMDLVVHEADWRAGLGWMTRRYPDYFNPANPRAHQIAGTGAYSSSWADFDAEKMRKMAFMVNWKASFDFPYMGMFLPPVGDRETWTSFKGEKVSIERMRHYSRQMRRMGFHVLNYFNVTEFGTNIVFPPPRRKAASDVDLWKDPNDFLWNVLKGAVLLLPEKEKPSPEKEKPFDESMHPGTPYETWEGAKVTDPGDPVYREFLLEQAKRHISKLPESSGICIDRLDWLHLYNHQRDDGLSWCGDQAVASLITSWNSLMDSLGPLMHNADKVIYANNHDKRIDVLKHVDGIFDEFTYGCCPLNLTALLCVRKPALGWTGNERHLKPDPDAFFQKYLYMGVFPMAPFPGNDHSLRPSQWVDAWYLDYGPLLKLMVGKRWVLEPHVIDVPDRNAKANIFEVENGYVVPVVFAAKSDTVRVIIKGLKRISGAQGFEIKALHPGSEVWTPVKVAEKGDILTLTVPVKRGCAMVQLVKK